MNNDMKISYPSSEKVYLKGQMFPDIRIAMRKVNLTPTVTKDAEGKNTLKKMHPF